MNKCVMTIIFQLLLSVQLQTVDAAQQQFVGTLATTDTDVSAFIIQNATCSKFFLGGCSLITDNTIYTIGGNFGQHLTHLFLAGCTNITDNSIIPLLQNCTSLSHLTLTGSNLLTDAVISEIQTHSTNLQMLIVIGCTGISSAALDRLTEARPTIRITR